MIDSFKSIVSGQQSTQPGQRSLSLFSRLFTQRSTQYLCAATLLLTYGYVESQAAPIAAPVAKISILRTDRPIAQMPPTQQADEFDPQQPEAVESGLPRSAQWFAVRLSMLILLTGLGVVIMLWFLRRSGLREVPMGLKDNTGDSEMPISIVQETHTRYASSNSRQGMDSVKTAGSTLPAGLQSKKETLELFFSYAHEDEDLRDKLAKHLKILERQKVISAWYDRDITAGDEWKVEILDQLNRADIILLLISADFLVSDFCWGVELELAMARHAERSACVIPIILRPVDWKDTPFAKLQALPKNAEPVTNWVNPDQAFTDIAKGIRKVAERLKS